METFVILHFLVFTVWAILGLASPFAKKADELGLLMIVGTAFFWEVALLAVIVQKLRGKI